MNPELIEKHLLSVSQPTVQITHANEILPLDYETGDVVSTVKKHLSPPSARSLYADRYLWAPLETHFHFNSHSPHSSRRNDGSEKHISSYPDLNTRLTTPLSNTPAAPRPSRVTPEATESSTSPPYSNYELLLSTELFNVNNSTRALSKGDSPCPPSHRHFGGPPSPCTFHSLSLSSPSPFNNCANRPSKDRAAAALIYSLTPFSKHSENIFPHTSVRTRLIPSTPFQVLDAPLLQDDFYLNVVSWSHQNILAVALSSSVYLWNAASSNATLLTKISSEYPGDTVTSLQWDLQGNILAIGTNKGLIQLWDCTRQKLVHIFKKDHAMRVGALSWNPHRNTLSSGSRDHLIITRDIRAPSSSLVKCIGHRQEVCGLKWNPDGSYLASGGNDNKLCIWSEAAPAKPLQKIYAHVAAIKAIAWSPHERGLLASGGGTADRTIKFWNICTATKDEKVSNLSNIDTGSQVCNLVWSNNVNELVSSHGYSQNHVSVWDYPSLSQIASLSGHNTRVLYMDVSPDGRTVVTGAGDETLRFWNIFPPANQKETNTLSPSGIGSLSSSCKVLHNIR